MFFTNSIQITKIAGVPIFLDQTWIALVAMTTYHVAVYNYGPLTGGWIDVQKLSVGFVVFLLIQYSILHHEFGHIFAARKYGIQTKGICLGLLGGAAFLDKDPETPRQQFFITIAGPGVNFALAGFGLFLHAILDGMISKDLILILQYFWIVNLGMGIFNLVPIYPLDGGRLLNSFLWWITKSEYRALVISDWLSLFLCFGLLYVGCLLFNILAILLSVLLLLRAFCSIRNHLLEKHRLLLKVWREHISVTQAMLERHPTEELLQEIKKQIQICSQIEEHVNKVTRLIKRRANVSNTGEEV